MEKQQRLRGRIKEKIQERKKKIRKAIVRHKDGFLTALEKNWRDTALKPLTTLLWNIGITANMVSWFGVAIIISAIWMYFKNFPLETQLLLLLAAAITDFLDGPLARNHNNVTILGTWLDHSRDGFLVAWATYLVYHFKLMDSELLIILWALQLVFLWITFRDFLILYLKGVTEEETLITQFSLSNLQTSLTGRIQFFSWAAGYGFLLGTLVLDLPSGFFVGKTLIIIAIIFSALNISESYQKNLR